MPKSRRGSGSIYTKRGWYYLSYYVNGKEIVEATRTKSRAEARRLLDIRAGEIAEGRYLGRDPERVTVGQLLDDLLAEYEVNQRRSGKALGIRIEKHLRPVFGHIAAQQLKTAGVQRYILSRQSDRASNATINRELAALKRAYALGVQGEKIAKRPHVPMLQEDNVRRGFFESDQFAQVLSALKDYLQPVMTFAYYTGWRTQSEILPLTWSHVDLHERTVRLEPGEAKNRKPRTIHLPDILWTIIEAQWKLHTEVYPNCPWVFHRDGQQIRDYRKAWAGARKRAGLPDRLPHDFRRTAVRNLVRAGIPERVAMEITGHKTRAVFERYNIVSDGDLQDAARRIDRAALARNVEHLPEHLPNPKIRRIAEERKPLTH